MHGMGFDDLSVVARIDIMETLYRSKKVFGVTPCFPC